MSGDAAMQKQAIIEAVLAEHRKARFSQRCRCNPYRSLHGYLPHIEHVAAMLVSEVPDADRRAPGTDPK